MTHSPEQRKTQDLGGRLVEQARKAGANAADVLIADRTSLSASCRLGALEDIERAEARDVGLRVFVGQRQGIIASNSLTDQTIDDFVARAVAMAKATPEDPFACLADPALFPSETQIAERLRALELFDETDWSADTLKERALTCEATARDVEGITNSEGASASWRRTHVTFATTEGFLASYQTSNHALGCSVIAGSGTGMESDYEYSSARYAADLRSPEAVGLEAAQRTIAKLNPRKTATQTVPVLYDRRVSSSLLSHLVGAISGTAIARGTSFLRDGLGTPVFGKAITIIDDPLKPRGLRSRPFDGEAVAGKRRALVDGGVLQTWLLDLSTARQLKLETTGHAARGVGGLPSPASTNLWLEPGSASPGDLMADIKDGFYVTSLIGRGVNPVTGDYSRGAAGFWIENGQCTDPVSEVTIAGNLNAMFAGMIPADDLEFSEGINAPTVRIDGLTVAGT
ncbi:MAG: TldD/PmbA family protein [Pseudomonadota bacterium]